MKEEEWGEKWKKKCGLGEGESGKLGKEEAWETEKNEIILHL